ncbi:sodium-dependent glucose transporter 1C [Dermacentor silvarum]|uniref:sodium-dependent glucose transporter 1C n=1 Tax=Dermacentor silvarum TaxID=543639 RepID=UPI001898D8AF|nr:sodium-dependent glucose transporter 1C [Dermacentor silvarum]XP_037571435.2 sodium-dependent glucose transporter 1C [Dermacentor silvarum]
MEQASPTYRTSSPLSAWAVSSALFLEASYTTRTTRSWSRSWQWQRPALAVTMIPLSGILALAHVTIFLCGLSVAALCTGANVWIIRMWTENSSPALQLFHFAFGIGGFVGPFIARPFLSNSDGGNATTSNTTDNVYLTQNNIAYPPVNLVELGNSFAAQNGTGESRVYCAFGIAGALLFIPTVSMIVLYIIDNVDFKPSTPEGDSSAGAEEPRNTVWFTRIVLAIMCLYIGTYVAFESTTSQMMASFAVKSKLHFSKSLASRVESVYFLSYAAGRLTACLVTIKVPPFWVLVSAHVILLPTAVTLALLGSNSSTVLWLSSALFGFGQGPIFASLVSWTAGLININNKMMALAAVTQSIGSMTAPVIVGQFLDNDPNVFLYVCLMTVALCVVSFATMYLYVRRARHRSDDKELLINEADSEHSKRLQ